MEDQFFDVCVQMCILGYVLEEDKKHCFDLVNDLLTDTKFQEWTNKLSMEEIEHTAWLFLNHYGTDIIDEVRVKLPIAMKKLLSDFKTLQYKNALEVSKLKHNATKQTFQRAQGLFDAILHSQQQNIYELEWKNM